MVMEEKDFAELITDICMDDEEFWKMTKKHHFSADYRRRKRKKIRELRRQKKDEGYGFLPLYPVRRRRAFVILVLLMILLMGVAITAKELRLKYFQTLELRGLDDHVEIATASDISGMECTEMKSDARAQGVLTEEPTASLGYVLEEYELGINYIHGERQCFIVDYENDSGEVIRFTQACEVNDMGVTTDGKKMTNVMVNDYEGVYIPDDDRNILLWYDGTYYYLISGSVSQEELLRMAESVE